MAAGVGAADEHPVPRTAGPIRIDGRLDDPAWTDVPPLSLGLEWFPGDNTPAPVVTDCRVTFDDENLYIGCRAEDPRPGEIRASLSDRDDLSGDDQLIFWIDASNDRRTAYRFAVNPYGVQADGLSLQGSVDSGWDTIWDSAGRIDERGWTVEVSIPFRSFQFPEGQERWGFVAARVWPRTARTEFGSVVWPRDDSCLLCRSTQLVGLDGVRPGRDIEVSPTLTLLSVESRSHEITTDVEAGASATWNATPYTRFAATVNPDFSQVEADADELDVNERFSIRFDEKRPFFTEGEDAFDTFGNLDLLFTRTVADPRVGLKATGRVGSQSFGALVTVDAVNNVLLPGTQESDIRTLDQDATGAMARHRLDVGQSSSLGLVATARTAPGYRNVVTGQDGLVRRGPHRLRWVGAVSQTEYPASLAPDVEVVGRSFEGASGYARYDLGTHRWGVEASYRFVGPDFRADAGFVPRVGVRGPEAQLSHILWGDRTSWFDRIRIDVEAQDLRATDGLALDRKLSGGISYEGPGQTEGDAEVAVRTSRFDDRLHDLLEGEIALSTRPWRLLGLSASIAAGEEIDSDSGDPGDLLDLRLGCVYRSGHHVRADASYRWQRLLVDGERAFSAHVPQATVEYHFSRAVFARSVLQYRDVLRGEPGAERRRRAFVQLLFAWRTDPRTVLFAGADQRYDGETAVRPTDRSIFVKLSYAMRI